MYIRFLIPCISNYYFKFQCIFVAHGKVDYGLSGSSNSMEEIAKFRIDNALTLELL